MDSEKQHKGCCKPEVSRGCSFCNCGNEAEAHACDGCFKLHETAWLEQYPDNVPTDIVEIRFKNTRRSFYQNVNNLPLQRGDIVAVESSPGHDVGIVSLTGEMVAKQMRRTGFSPLNGEFKKVYRKAKPYDIEKWQEAIAMEHETMILARQLASDMGLNMKIGDVEYQADKIKAIFYYIADERVDFRELIKVFAERFHIRIEMKQIGARQEAGRIGGIGACGRELCCASWIASFSSVSTGAARTQDISPNPQKLAGQCSKLKCCMVYEYDTYVDARKDFPRLRDPLQTIDGEWYLVKSDVLAGTMNFSSSKDALVNLTTLTVERVREIMAINRTGKKVDQLRHADDLRPAAEEPSYRSGSDEDSITRFDAAKRRRKRPGRDGRVGEERAELSNGNKEGVAKENSSDNRGENRNPNRPNRGNNPRREGGNRDNSAPRDNAVPREAREGGVVRENGAPREPREGGNNNRGERNRSNDRPRGDRPRGDRRAEGGNHEPREGSAQRENTAPREPRENPAPREPREGGNNNRNRQRRNGGRNAGQGNRDGGGQGANNAQGTQGGSENKGGQNNQ